MNTSAKIVKISLTAIEKRPEVVGREGELMKNVCKVLYVVDVRETHFGKISAQPHNIVKQICFPNGNVLF